MLDLTQVATELYGLPPTEFTAARTAAVRVVRRAGDRDLARDIGALRRPATAAAAVNLLVRRRPADVGRLLELGARLREAQAALAGVDLRALHAEQHRVMAEVVGEAIDLVSADGRAGPAVRGQIEGTLRAAMGDPDAAAAVRTGLLTRDLFSSGFEPVDVAGAIAVPDAPPLVGVPARPTPLRAVPSRDERARAENRDGDTEESGEAGESGDEVRPPARGGRRRGRLITSDEPGRPGRPGRPELPELPERPEHPGHPARMGSAAARQAARESARRQADEDVALAEQDALARATARDTADQRLSIAETRIVELTEVIERTEQEIARLREVLATARQDARDEGLEVRHARSARTTAIRAADRAEQRTRAARDHRDRL